MDASSGLERFAYRIVSERPEGDRLELHILARAYRQCWIAVYAQAPTGRHWFEGLGVAIEFSATEG